MHLILASAFSLLTISASSFATSFFIRPFSEFTQSAPIVVRGILSNPRVESSITSDGSRTIYTYANLDVKESIKGNVPTGNVLIRKIGGTKDNVTLEIPGSPEFLDGEETVLFLSPQQEDRSYEVTGLELGKFGLKDEKGERILTGGLFAYSKNMENDADGHANRAADLSENQRSWTLSELKTLVQRQGSGPITNKNGAPNQTSHSVSPTSSPTLSPSVISNQLNPVTTKNSIAPDPEKPATSLLYWGIALIAAIGLIIYFRGR